MCKRLATTGVGISKEKKYKQLIGYLNLAYLPLPFPYIP
jgi:hypothetical protein